MEFVVWLGYDQRMNELTSDNDLDLDPNSGFSLLLYFILLLPVILGGRCFRGLMLDSEVKNSFKEKDMCVDLQFEKIGNCKTSIVNRIAS